MKNKKSLLLYICTGAAFLLILSGFILAAVFGPPDSRPGGDEAANYDGKIAAMRQKFTEGTGICAVMIDDPLREETLYFDKAGAVRKFAKNGDALRIEGDAETLRQLADSFFEGIVGDIPFGGAATDADFTFDDEVYKVFLATEDGVTVLTYTEADTAGSALFTSYRETLVKLDALTK